jgi:hypothetical protein
MSPSLPAVSGHDKSCVSRLAHNGSVVCDASNDQLFPLAVPDGAGGAIIVWQDNRNGAGDIYAQRMSPAGAPLWAANGIVICSATGDQNTATIAADGAGGALIAWVDTRTGSSPRRISTPSA